MIYDFAHPTHGRHHRQFFRDQALYDAEFIDDRVREDGWRWRFMALCRFWALLGHLGINRLLV